MEFQVITTRVKISKISDWEIFYDRNEIKLSNFIKFIKYTQYKTKFFFLSSRSKTNQCRRRFFQIYSFLLRKDTFENY